MLLSYFISTSALKKSSDLLSYLTIILALNNTIVLITTRLSNFALNQLIQIRGDHGKQMSVMVWPQRRLDMAMCVLYFVRWVVLPVYQTGSFWTLVETIPMYVLILILILILIALCYGYLSLSWLSNRRLLSSSALEPPPPSSSIVSYNVTSI